MTLRSIRFFFFAAILLALWAAASCKSRPATAAKTPAIKSPAGIAAVVDGQEISLARVTDIALRVGGAQVLDQIVGQKLIHQEAVRRSLAATSAEMDARVALIRAGAKPHTLDEALRARHTAMSDFLESIRAEVEVKKLLQNRLLRVRMVHVRQIFAHIPPFGSEGSPRSPEAARQILRNVQRELAAGASFDSLARRYSDDDTSKRTGGDFGVITSDPTIIQDPEIHRFAMQPAFLKGCLALGPGQVTATPIRTRFGLHLIQAVSTGDRPGVGDASLYRDARTSATENQLVRLAPAFVDSLRRTGKVVIYLGQKTPGPAGVAADVNGEEIPVSKVAGIVVANIGSGIADSLINNALIHTEAARKQVLVSDADVNNGIDEVRRQMNPASLEAVLAAGHMTFAELRDSQKAKLEAQKIVGQSVGVFKAVHVREIAIIIKNDPRMLVGHPDLEAHGLMAKITAALRAGRAFEDLARKYGDTPFARLRAGDIGVITEKDQLEPELVKRAMALKKGEVSEPFQTPRELIILKALSTSTDHPDSESGQYDEAEKRARDRVVQSQLNAFVGRLRSVNRFSNYLAG